MSSTVQPVAAAATVVPSYTQSATYSTTAVTYSGKTDKLYVNGKQITKHWLETVLIFSGIILLVVAGIELIDGCYCKYLYLMWQKVHIISSVLLMMVVVEL